MGWFWESSPSGDPTKKLSPELREYLEKERPAEYVPTSSSQQSKENFDSSRARTPSSSTTVPEDTKPRVPAASLFPDGRYAHLWKTYKPPVEQGNAELNAAERVVEKHKERHNSVNNAALENCAVEQEALSTCFQKGDWWTVVKARTSMCAEQNRQFSRCYTMQAKFLQALGYASAMEWDEDREERIQMHADKLYHQMLDYERQVAEARAAGVEPPPITSLFSPEARNTTEQSGANLQSAHAIPEIDQLPQGMKKPAKWDDLTPHEREVEIQSYKAERAQQKMYAEQAAPFLKKYKGGQSEGKEKSGSSFGETLGRWLR